MTYSIFDIHAWQKAYEFTLLSYKATKGFPDFEKYGLASQFQRAAVSIVANIAEGSRKTTKPDKLKFMNIAQGSLEECRCYVLLAKDLEYISAVEHDILTACLEDTSRLLNAFTEGIETHDFNSQI